MKNLLRKIKNIIQKDEILKIEKMNFLYNFIKLGKNE